MGELVEDLPLACLYCAAAITVVDVGRQREYCSKRCSNAHRVQRNPDLRPAVEEKPSVPCAACGTDFVQFRKDKTTCSRRCWYVTRGQALLVPLPLRACALLECGAMFQPIKTVQRACSEAHGKKLWNRENPESWNDRRRDNYHRRKALKRGSSTGRPVRLTEIRERDKNRCHLCGDKVQDKAWPHPLSPSLDHVVPLSRGGIHDPDNVRLAHLRCNVEKGAGGGNEQLLLIG